MAFFAGCHYMHASGFCTNATAFCHCQPCSRGLTRLLGLQDNAAITPVISKSSADFIEGLVKNAEDKGAKLLQAYKREGNLIWPLLIDNVTRVRVCAPQHGCGDVMRAHVCTASTSVCRTRPGVCAGHAAGMGGAVWACGACGAREDRGGGCGPLQRQQPGSAGAAHPFWHCTSTLLHLYVK